MMDHVLQAARLPQTIENLPGGVFVYRCSDKQILYANAKMIEMLGCTDWDDMMAYTGGVYANIMHDEDRDRMQESIRQQLSYHHDNFDHLEYRIVMKSGQIRFVEDYGQKIHDEKEGDLFYIFVVDSERKLLAYDMDELTELPRQHRFLTHARQYHAFCLQTKTNPVYIYFDLSNFKMYNLNYGAESGDIVLRQVASILQNVFVNDFVARAAEDHFIVLTDEFRMVERTQLALDQIDALHPEANIYCRAGLCRLEPPYSDPAIAVNLAREACNSVKRDSSKHLQVYSEEHNRRLKMRAYVTEHIDEAIREGHIQVYYQPVIRLISRSLAGFEALARWNSPELGFLSPADFIPALEASHQIHKLDCAMIREVCRQYQATIREGRQPVPVSFNLSRLDFQVEDIASTVRNLADEYSVPHEMLNVEITESTLASDDSLILGAIEQFHQDGFNVWMDDFGSGYSTLNSLKDYTFDKLKIDMNFLSTFTEKSQKIIASIVQMAKEIGIHTLAEGVETEEQVAFLHHIGCEEAQGYFFGKPLPMQESLAQVEEKGIFPLPVEEEVKAEEEPIDLKEGIAAFTSINFIDTKKSPEESMEQLLDFVGKQLECSRIYVFTKNDFEHYDCEVEWVGPNAYSKKKMLQDLPPAICAPYYRYFRQRRRLMVRNIEDLKSTDPKLYEILKPQELQSFMAGQLLFNGEDIGFFGIDNPSPDKFDELSLAVEMIGYYMAGLVGSQRMIRALERIGLVDRLTRTGNRHSLFERVEHLEQGKKLGVIYFDLCDLKILNDQGGHAAGDAALRKVGDVLSQQFGSESVYRVGGDEFVALRPGMGEEEIRKQLAEANEKFKAKHIRVSSGLAWQEHYEGDFGALLNLADERMYEDKNQGKG